MGKSMQIIELDQLKKVLSIEEALQSVKQGFIDFDKGNISCPEPMQILFHDKAGNLDADCHVKSASGTNQPYFVIKIASGFYHNPSKDLPVNNGMVMVMSALTGEPVALLNDHGWLTSQRTAAAGALAAGLRKTNPTDTLGIIGTGSQAYFQAIFTCKHLGLSSVAIYGRNHEKALALCQTLEKENIKATTMHSVKELCNNVSVLITTTPSTKPIVMLEDLPSSIHIVAIGADSPGKVELSSDILVKASTIITDDHAQCLHHGEVGHAVREGVIEENKDRSLGKFLAEDNKIDEGISVVDLTGVGVQDLALASLVIEKVKGV